MGKNVLRPCTIVQAHKLSRQMGWRWHVCVCVCGVLHACFEHYFLGRKAGCSELFLHACMCGYA